MSNSPHDDRLTDAAQAAGTDAPPAVDGPCNICGHESFARIDRRSDGLNVVRCQHCGMGVVEERPTDPKAYYDDRYYGASEAGDEVGYQDYVFTAEHAVSWAAALVTLLKPRGRILDIGCVDGQLLRKLGAGFELHGIEVNRRMSARAAQNGITVIGDDLFDPKVAQAYRHRFDVVTAIAVFEHLVDFKRGVETALDLLTSDGVLLFEVPLLSQTHDNATWFNSSLEHVFYPSQRAIEYLFHEVLKVHLIGSEIYIRDFASNYIGIVTKRATDVARLRALFLRLTDPDAHPQSAAERTARRLLLLVHAAASSDDLVEGIADLPWSRPMTMRVGQLWKTDVQRLRNVQAAHDAVIEARDFHAAAAARLRAACDEAARQNNALRSERDALKQEQQVIARSREESARRQLAEQTELLAKLEAGRAWLEQQFFNWRGVAEDRARETTGLREQVAAALATVGALQAKLDEARSTTATLEAALNQARSTAATLETALAQERSASAAAVGHARARTEILEAALADERSRTATLATALEREQSSTAVLEGTLKEQLARLRAVDAALQERVRQLTEVERRLSEREAMLEVVFTSTSWKLTVPVRAVGGFLREVRQRAVPQAAAPEIPLAAPAAELAAPPTEPVAPVPGLVVRRQKPWPASCPLVTVIIPCFNYGHFVAEAVDSVLAQTFQDFEILVVDGGSSSAVSLATLRELQRPKTQVYFREGRHLVGDNRNFGISRALGKYVCCLDADDMIRPTYLEKALFLLETQGYDLVSTAIRTFGNRSQIYQLKRFPVLADMLQGNQVTTCAVFGKDLWAQAGGFQDTGIGPEYFYEDWRLWMRFAALGARIANIVEEPLLLYRVHSSQSLSTQDEKVPSMDRQREAIAEFNRDVITDDALRLSEDNRRIQVTMEDGFVNLRRGFAPAPADEPTILLAMPFLIIGGAERLMSEVTRHLGTRGFRVVLVTTEYVDAQVHGDATPWFDGTTTRTYHLPRLLDRDRWPEFVQFLLQTRNFSLLWIIGSRVFYELLPEIKVACPELKVIDLLFNTIGHTTNNRKYAAYFDKILVENREVATWLIEAGERHDKVVQIPSGVDLEAYRPRPKSTGLLQNLGIAPDAFIAGYSGRLSEEKSPEAFLEIAGHCHGDPIVFLMTGAGPLADQVRQRREQMALGDRFHFVGQVDSVVSYMSTYDVLVLPSRLDGRPVAVLESLALGVPVVAARVGALPELIQDGVTGFLCEPGDIAAFAERIRWLAAHPEVHRRMKVAARAFAEATLDARHMCERYEEVIRGVLST